MLCTQINGFDQYYFCLFTARDAIPEIRSRLSELNAHVYPYDSRRHAQRHPFIVYIEGLDKDLHMDLHKYLRLWKAIGPATEMFETGWTDNAFFLFSKVVGELCV